jgi:hypothetical protein
MFAQPSSTPCPPPSGHAARAPVNRPERHAPTHFWPPVPSGTEVAPSSTVLGMMVRLWPPPLSMPARTTISSPKHASRRRVVGLPGLVMVPSAPCVLQELGKARRRRSAAEIEPDKASTPQHMAAVRRWFKRHGILTRVLKLASVTGLVYLAGAAEATVRGYIQREAITMVMC